jgi:hypothetical protein
MIHIYASYEPVGVYSAYYDESGRIVLKAGYTTSIHLDVDDARTLHQQMSVALDDAVAAAARKSIELDDKLRAMGVPADGPAL